MHKYVRSESDDRVCGPKTAAKKAACRVVASMLQRLVERAVMCEADVAAFMDLHHEMLIRSAGQHPLDVSGN